MRRSQPNESELAVWQATVRSGVVAEAESRLLGSIVAYARSVTSMSPRAVTAMTADVRKMLGVAVDAWFEEIHEGARGNKYPRLSAALMVSASLTPFDPAATATVLGPDHVKVIAAQRQGLNTRLGVVFDHIGERLCELWRLSVGDPAVDDLAGRVSAVAAAYQFADA